MHKNFPDNYEAVDLPSGYKPKAGTWTFWRSLKGLIIRDDKGVDIALDATDQTYAAGSTSTAPISHAAIAKVVDRLQVKSSVNPPNLDDLSWVEWQQNTYNFATGKRTVQLFWRTVDTNDLLPHPITWEIDVASPSSANATPDPENPSLLVSSLPQDVSFRFRETRESNGGMLCDVSFPTNTFTSIAYQLVDANKALIAGTARVQQVTTTDTAVGLGWATVPAETRFAQFTFAYRNGGNLPFEFAIN
ncbi:MAG: hypothetical protein ACRC62_39860 [Microcoleus sp.]